MTRLFIVLYWLLVAAIPAGAADWTAKPSASSLSFSGSHTGNRFDGRFDQWKADIRFDPDNLATAHVAVTIETGSAKTGNAMYDGTLPGEDWFHASAHPTATFIADNITRRADGSYAANGTLTIRSTTQPLTLVFTLEITGDRAVMHASHTLDRLDFGIGAASDPTGDWVSTDIALDIDITAVRQ